MGLLQTLYYHLMHSSSNLLVFSLIGEMNTPKGFRTDESKNVAVEKTLLLRNVGRDRNLGRSY